MPKVLIYDMDRGLSSLATDERIQEVFGYRPRRFVSTKTLMTLFSELHKPTTVTSEDILGIVQEEYYTMKSDIQIEVLDSLTAFQAQAKREAKGDAEKISLPMWGEIGEATEALVTKLARTDTHVIMIGHTKSEKDDDLGIIRYIPALSGRMKDEVERHFDLVLFTEVERDAQTGLTSYYWRVAADERRAAKCRIEPIAKFAQKSGGRIPQDFAALFDLAKDYQHIKILILGDSGTGKTYSLRTLSKVNLAPPAPAAGKDLKSAKKEKKQ